MEVRFAPGAILFFKRLKYTAWHALAEFVDNSTESYLAHSTELGAVAPADGAKLAVRIDYDSQGGGRIRIADTAMGMSEADVERALTIGEPPPGRRYRSQFGLGLKTAATWFGNTWSVRTKRLGSTSGLEFTFDVGRIAAGEDVAVTPYAALEHDHYTIVEINDLNRHLTTRTQERIANYLRRMYRNDLSEGWLRLIWMGEALEPAALPHFASGPDGAALRRDFAFDLGGKTISGWAGVLAEGSRAKAGFAVLHSNRVIRAAPDAWRPAAIYGEGGRNDLINQRLIGEIQLDAFPVSHSKDDIVWTGDQEQEVELELKKKVTDIISAARGLRKPRRPEPSSTDVRRAALALQRALAPSRLRDEWLAMKPGPTDAKADQAVVASAARRSPDFSAAVDGLQVAGYVETSLEPSDAYLVVARHANRISVVINARHPYASGAAPDALIVHAEHSTFDALAQWRLPVLGVSDATWTLLKDALLRIAASTRNGTST